MLRYRTVGLGNTLNCLLISATDPLNNLARRPSDTPPDVLYRSLAYAKAHNINALWIDQECIDQSDPMHQENGIQEMDKVYQESESHIAVLEFSFQSQIELDVFASICDWKLITFDPSHIEVLESVLIALTNERWFERAWTLQESVSAGAGMELLLGCSGLHNHLTLALRLESLRYASLIFRIRWPMCGA